MVTCSCGQTFASERALRRHRTGRAQCTPETTARAARPRPARGRNESWLWKHVAKTIVISCIEHAATEPSSTLVSSTSGHELVCSYNWRNGKDMRLHIPGSAALWRDLALPMTLPADQGLHYVDQNSARAPKFPFEPMFRATASMNAAFRFDGVDVLTNRNSLRKLLDFSAGHRQDSFRLNLHLVHRTLIIERYEKNVRQLVSGSRDPGWGKVFERRFTEYAPSLKDSISHHRSLQYRLGDLACVVQFEVDACYDKGGESDDESDVLSFTMDQLSLRSESANNTTVSNAPAQKTPMPQEMAAEIKTTSKPRSLDKNLPQLWFGRTPWLIVGHHTHGTFTECSVINVAEKFAGWEQQHQAGLRMLITVLGQLREAVEKNGGKHCVAICEKRVSPLVIQVFPSTSGKTAVPDNLKGKLWDAQAATRSVY